MSLILKQVALGYQAVTRCRWARLPAVGSPYAGIWINLTIRRAASLLPRRSYRYMTPSRVCAWRGRAFTFKFQIRFEVHSCWYWATAGREQHRLHSISTHCGSRRSRTGLKKANSDDNSKRVWLWSAETQTVTATITEQAPEGVGVLKHKVRHDFCSFDNLNSSSTAATPRWWTVIYTVIQRSRQSCLICTMTL